MRQPISRWNLTVALNRVLNVRFDLPVKNREPDTGAKREHPADLPSQPMSQKETFLLHAISKTPQIECPSILLPVCLPICPPDSLLLSCILFLCSVPASPLDLQLTLFNPVYNINRKPLD